MDDQVAAKMTDNNFERFSGILEEEVKKAKDGDYSLGVCFLYLDGYEFEGTEYSPILDELSWVIGNDAKVIDLIVPYSFMNIAVLLRKTLSVDVRESAERIRDAVSKRRFEVAGKEVRTTVSMGVSVYPNHGHNAAELSQKAQRALEAARNGGGNQVVVAD